jgi:hypothetical protein
LKITGDSGLLINLLDHKSQKHISQRSPVPENGTLSMTSAPEPVSGIVAQPSTQDPRKLQFSDHTKCPGNSGEPADLTPSYIFSSSEKALAYAVLPPLCKTVMSFTSSCCDLRRHD